MRVQKISKELLSIVLNQEVKHVAVDLKWIRYNVLSDATESEIAVYFDNSWNILNIYEITHKCKEWAITQYDNYFVTVLHEDMTARAIITEDDFGFNANSEPEAIIMACEWLLTRRISNDL